MKEIDFSQYNHTTPEKYIPAVTIPAKTYIYKDELKKQVLQYMDDRHDYLAAGRHILDDLSRTSYIDKLADIFTNLSKDEIELHFDQLGQAITDEREYKRLKKHFSKNAIVPNLNGTKKEFVEFIKDLRKWFFENRPTKGWYTAKMEAHKLEVKKRILDRLGIEISGVRKLHGSVFTLIDGDKYFSTGDFLSQSEYYQNQPKEMEFFSFKIEFFDHEKRWEAEREGTAGIMAIHYNSREETISINEKTYKIK
jgi:hypothetical protein